MTGRIFLDPTPERLNEMYRNHRRRLGHPVAPDEEIPAQRTDLRTLYTEALRLGDTDLLNDSASRPVGG